PVKSDAAAPQWSNPKHESTRHPIFQYATAHPFRGAAMMPPAAAKPRQRLKNAATFASKATAEKHQIWEHFPSECVAAMRHTIFTLL
ncbi:MAG TPA: hypothetical protein VJQ55_13505, partial [Candidatus Binatia bacterium]|nr:hypothetical protein [Candidatus Binatia bacterium]